jgi:type IV secretory pathway TraG/TraD family ATPase VirD4
MTDDDVCLIFDTKGDYAKEFFSSDNGDSILYNSGEFLSESVKWNIYNDILADGNDESIVKLNINEIARALFAENESQTQPFFPKAARGVLFAYMMSVIRPTLKCSYSSKKDLDNSKLVAFFNRFGNPEYKSIIDANRDLGYIKTYLGDMKNEQSLGVMAEVMIMLNDLFVGRFGEQGDFSIRQFVRRRSKKILFVEYDLAVGETLSPMYSLLVDFALKEALSPNTERKGRIFIILDELKLLPNLVHLDDAVNFGRDMGVRVIAGLQSIAQLYDQYGEYKSKAILAGFNTLFAFRPNDALSREYIKEQYGKCLITESYESPDGEKVEMREAYNVEDWDLLKLPQGKAFVNLDSSHLFSFYFKKYLTKEID